MTQSKHHHHHLDRNHLEITVVRTEGGLAILERLQEEAHGDDHVSHHEAQLLPGERGFWTCRVQEDQGLEEVEFQIGQLGPATFAQVGDWVHAPLLPIPREILDRVAEFLGPHPEEPDEEDPHHAARGWLRRALDPEIPLPPPSPFEELGGCCWIAPELDGWSRLVRTGAAIVSPEVREDIVGCHCYKFSWRVRLESEELEAYWDPHIIIHGRPKP